MKKDRIYIRKYENGCIPAPPVEITQVFTMFLRCCEAPFVFAGELHDQWELVYVRSGEASITADDNVYHLSAGSLIFHKPMEFHQIHAEQVGLELFVASFYMDGEGASKFEQAVFELLPGEKERFEEVIRCSTKLNGRVFRDLEYWDCCERWRAAPLEFHFCVHQLESVLCLLLLRSPTLQQPKDTADSLLYRKIVAVLEEHVCTDITIREVAERCDVSPTSVKACFSRHAGCGLHKYFLKIKMRTAVQLIREGHSVSHVSDELGFNNPNYFTYVFRRETGKRPTDFRV